MTISQNASTTYTDDHVHNIFSVTSTGLITNEQRLIFQWIFYSIVTEFMNIFGTITNIINIVCFVKQGVKDAVNISLLGLAISDLGCLITLIWTGICYNPVFNELDLPFEPIEVQYLTAGGPHIIFARITSCITAFITLERCLCVTMPLKVKTVFTAKRVKMIIVILFISVMGILLPGYCGSKIASKFSLARNKTIVGVIFAEYREIVEAIVFGIGGVILEFGAFVTVVACTIILVVKLRDKTKWRQLSTAPGQSENVSSRDRKVTKMVIVVSTLFIICFTPTCVTMASMILEPEFSVFGKYSNLMVCAFSVCFALESVNSATNIFIYYYMSSNFKTVLRQLCSTKRCKKLG